MKIIEATAMTGVFIILALLSFLFFTDREIDFATTAADHLGTVILVIGWLGWIFVAIAGLAFCCYLLFESIVKRIVKTYGLFVIVNELKRLEEAGPTAYRKEKRAALEAEKQEE